MLKLLSRGIFRFTNFFVPSSRLAPKRKDKYQMISSFLKQIDPNRKQIKANPLTELHLQSPLNQNIRQHIKQIFSLLYFHDVSRPYNRNQVKNPSEQFHLEQNLQKITQDLCENLLQQKSSLSLSTLKKSLIILTKLHENGVQNIPQETLEALEERLYFLHDNYFLFDKKFSDTIVILKGFTALQYKLSNKEYLKKWHKYASENLKFFTSKQTSEVLYVSVFQLPENKDIYQTIKLQLFKPTSLYYQELLRSKLYINPKEYPRVYDLVKAIFNRLVLSSYQRKGLYWQKDYNFEIGDLIRVIQAHQVFGEDNGAYLGILLGRLKENIKEIIEEDADVRRYQKPLIKLLPLLINFSEKEISYLGERYKQMLELWVMVIINTIPIANINQIAVISESFEKIENHMESDKSGINVCKAQLVEYLEDYLGKVVDKEIQVDLAGVLTKIFIDLAPVFGSEAAGLKKLVLAHFEKLSKNIGEVLYKENEVLAMLNKLIKQVKIEGEVVVDKLRGAITEADLSQIKPTELLALNYLVSFSLVKKASGYRNLEYFVDYLYKNLAIKTMHQETCSMFFESYANLFKSDELSRVPVKAKEQIEELKKSLLRYTADHYKEFSKEGLEFILWRLLEAEQLEVNFDDGSGLYDKNIIQEVQEYLTKHLNECSVEFQDQIKPFLEKYREATAMESLVENIKNLSF